MVKKNEIYKVICERNGFSGEGIVSIDGFLIFVPYLIEGEEAEIKILKVLSSHGFGKIEKLLTKSADRREVSCPAFKRCGGCSFLHMSYELQLKIKRRQVMDCFNKYARGDYRVKETVPSDKVYGYRNKAQYPFSGERYGFYAKRSHDLIPFENCLMQDSEDGEILKAVSEYIKKTKAKIRHLYIRRGKDACMVVLVSKKTSIPFSNVLVSELTGKFKKIKSIILNVNPNDTNVILGEKNIVLYGSDKIEAEIGNKKFKVSPMSFFQINSSQTAKLYDTAGSYIGENDKCVLDLYCGIGSVGQYLSDKAERIIGVEIVKEAVADAEENKKINGIKNAEYICSPAEDAIRGIMEKGEKIDAVILDPPRKGCDEKLLGCLKENNVKKIIYISCNPATLARDVSFMSDRYNASEITPVDMFPNTPHVEAVCLLKLKSSGADKK